MTSRRLPRWAPFGYAGVVLAAVWSLLVTTGLADAADPFRPDRTEVTVEFTRAIGLYPGDSVHVQGIESGTVDSVEPELDKVVVRLSIEDVALAPDAIAVMRLRSLIGERYIELGPVWSGEGEPLADGAIIPPDRTIVPMELSEILEETGRLVGGIDEEAVSTLVRELADALEGREQVIAAGLADLAEVSSVLSHRADEIDEGLTHLAGVMGALSERDRQLVEILQGAAVVSEALTAQDGALEAAIDGLDGMLAEVADLTVTQRETLLAIMDAFDRAGLMLAQRREDFAGVIDELPYLSYGYERSVQHDGDRWFVVNNARGLFFLPSGDSMNSGPGAPDFTPIPRIYHTEDSPLHQLSDEQVDATEVTGPGPLLPNTRIGPSGIEFDDDDPGGGGGS